MNLKLGNTEEVGGPGSEEQEISRAERKALKKAQADAKAKKALAKGVGGVKEEKEASGSEEDSEEEDVPSPAVQKKAVAKADLTRKERSAPLLFVQGRADICHREAAEKKAAQERYAKLHAQGQLTEPFCP